METMRGSIRKKVPNGTYKMKLKITQLTPRLIELEIEKDTTYEVEDIIQDTYKIKVPMKRQGKFKYALVGEDEGELLDE